MLTAEREKFGVAHNELGGYLLHWWQLPYALVEAALYHHEPLAEHVVHKELLCLVHIANSCSWNQLLKKESYCVDESIWRFVGLQPDVVTKILSEPGTK